MIATSTLAAIVAMTVATLATRFGGLVLVRFVKPKGRMKRMLEAIPPAVLTAVIVPTALSTGIAETIACIATVLAALRLSLLPSVLIGVTCVAVLRATGL